MAEVDEVPLYQQKPLFRSDLRSRLQELREEYTASAGQWRAREILREVYDMLAPLLLWSAAKNGTHVQVEPYPLDWLLTFSHIEFSAWQDIRQNPNVALYPEYPVGQYFIDFANPALMVGVELDGKDYHGAEKDWRRDIELLRMGWLIFRVPGTEAWKAEETPEEWQQRMRYEEREVDSNGLHYAKLRYYMESSEGFIRALGVVLFAQEHDDPDFRYCLWSLEKHLSLRIELDRLPHFRHVRWEHYAPPGP
jgi:very-short-patch-repair endonuclease